MKKLLTLALSTILLFGSAIAQSNSAFDTAKGTAHHIEFRTVLEGDSCSATAVGKHTLLTAAHCVMGTGKLVVDGDETTIKNIQYDEQDHALITIADKDFDKFVAIDQRDPKEKEVVFMWGWPGKAENPVYRTGQLKKIEKDEEGTLDIWVLPSYPGDSGSGLISSDGKVIAVLSLGDKSADAASLPMAFSDKQLSQIE